MRKSLLLVALLTPAVFAQVQETTTTTTTRVYTTPAGQPVQTETVRTTTVTPAPVAPPPAEHWLYFQQGFHPYAQPPIVQEQIIEHRHTETVTPVK